MLDMLQKSYVNTLKKDFLAYAAIRRDVIKNSDDALHHAKRAIFALHRDDVEEAEAKLKQSADLLSGVTRKHIKNMRVQSEGSYLAALEEFVEASLFYQFVTTGKIGEVKGILVPPESYIAGLCDVPGELLRFAIKSATEKDVKMVKKCAATGQEIMGELIEFNLTSYLRNKFDQAKNAVRRMEEVVYEVSLRE